MDLNVIYTSKQQQIVTYEIKQVLTSVRCGAEWGVVGRGGGVSARRVKAFVQLYS